MSTEEYVDEIEKRGFNHLQMGRWREARECFEEMLTLPLSPIRQVKVLRNISGTYEKEGAPDQAIHTCEKALDLIENHNLWYESDEGAILRGSIKGRLARLKGTPATALGLPIALLGAYINGAAIGALLGAQIQINSVNINGPVLTDLRYGGAGVGALLGLLIFRSMFTMSGTILSIIGSIIGTGFLFYILTANDLEQGMSVFALILFVPIALFFYIRSRGQL